MRKRREGWWESRAVVSRQLFGVRVCGLKNYLSNTGLLPFGLFARGSNPVILPIWEKWIIIESKNSLSEREGEGDDQTQGIGG